MHDILDVIGKPGDVVAHRATGGISDFGVLNMHPCIGKPVETSGVVVVQMGQDHIANRVRGQADLREGLRRFDVDRTATFSPGAVPITGVDQHCPFAAARDPDEEIQRHRPVVHVAPQEVFVHPTFWHPRVPQGVDLPYSRRSGADWQCGVGFDRHGVLLHPMRRADIVPSRIASKNLPDPFTSPTSVTSGASVRQRSASSSRSS